MKTQITMKEFFNLEHVRNAQAVQKAHPYGSPEHRAAFYLILAAACRYGVQEWFPADYES